MAKRQQTADLDELLTANVGLPMIMPGDVCSGAEPGQWFIVGLGYKSEHVAQVSASIFRRRVGRDRARFASRGKFVYVCYNAALAATFNEKSSVLGSTEIDILADRIAAIETEEA